VAYLLKPMRKAQLKAVDEMLEAAADAIEVVLKEGPSVAMNRFNRKPEMEV
jgi:PTH1 family peptidyl-tRNA hydrolase